MRINKVSTLTGMSKKAIHYYISEKLLSPESETNGYTNFSDNDVATLLQIRNLRNLGLRVLDIRQIVKYPETAVFYLIKHKRELSRSISHMEQQYAITADILDDLEKGTTTAKLQGVLKRHSSTQIYNSEQEQIDTTDAELLAYFFWGGFMHGKEMDEYRRFLWDRLIKYIVANQTKDMISLRDYLYSRGPEEIKAIFVSHSGIIDEIKELRQDSIKPFVRKLIEETRSKLDDSLWVSRWKQCYSSLITPTAIFFDSKASKIVSEFTPEFRQYQQNMNTCCQMFLSYLESPEGVELKNKINTTLDGYIDMYSNHNIQLVGLYLF